MTNQQPYIDPTKNWLNNFVIQLGLCPFAKRPFINEQIEYNVIDAQEKEAQLMAFWNAIEKLKQSDAEKISTTLLILPDQYPNFLDYLNFFELAESLLMERGEEESFQLASFHPQYQFAGTTVNDVSNYTNRSPFPIIHILRTAEVAEAIDLHQDTAKIPERNIQLMEDMGLEKVAKLLGI